MYMFWVGILAFVLMPIWSAQAMKITIGVEDITYYPHYTTRSGEYSGFARALLDAWAKDRGYEIVYHPVPVSRLYHTMLAGHVDLKYPDNSLWAEELKAGKKVFYSRPVTAYVDGTMVRPELQGKGFGRITNLGSVLGFTPLEWGKHIQSGEVYLNEVDSLEQLIRQSLQKRIDAVWVNVAVMKFQLESLNLNNKLVFDRSLPYVKDYYYISSTTRPDLLKDYNDWHEMNKNRIKELKRLYQLEIRVATD